MSSFLRRGLSMTSAIPQEPMLVIIGATGTGKSKVIQAYPHVLHGVLTVTASWRLS